MKLQASKPVALRLPTFNRVYLTLVGCGGTGSHLASGLATIALALREKDIHGRLTFIDPDKVEEKNVGRQLFTSGEVGLAKAYVLAQRIGSAYGLPYEAVIQPAQQQDLGIGTGDDLSVVIGAVDNAPARGIISKAVEKAKGQLWWVDAGNENHSGQVALGNCVDRKRWQPTLGMVDSLPAPHVVYPDLIKTKRQPRRSCADTPEQGLMTNRMAAAWALSMLNDFLLGQLRYFAVDFDLAFGGMRARLLDEATLKEI